MLTFCAAASAATFDVTPADDVETLLQTLSPGDVVVVHGGVYELSGRFSVSLAGTAAQPITIEAAPGEVPTFHRALQDQNVWDLDAAAFVTLRGLVWSGGSAGLRLSDVHDLTVEDCEITGTGDVAFRANDVGQDYANLVVRHNQFHHTDGTGEGMYLGCNEDGCRVRDSLVEGNWVHHTNGPGVSQGDGIELKEGSHDVVIRDNVIHDTNYPCILTYSTVGNGGPNTIERNVLWNCGDHGIQTAADAVIRNNVVLSAAGAGIALQPHQNGVPGGLVVVHNTVLNAGDALALRELAGSATIANNALYSQSGEAFRVVGGVLGGLVDQGNVTTGDVAADFVGASFAGAPPLDVFPTAGGALAGAADPAHLAADDFDGRGRTAPGDVGAYALAGGGAGWPLAEGFKVLPPETDTDTDTDTDSDTDSDTDTDTDADTDSDTTDLHVTYAHTGPADAPKDAEGCGCHSTGGGAVGWAALVGAVTLRRRRPRAVRT